MSDNILGLYLLGFKKGLPALPSCKFFNFILLILLIVVSQGFLFNLEISCTCEFFKTAEIALAEAAHAISAL